MVGWGGRSGRGGAGMLSRLGVGGPVLSEQHPQSHGLLLVPCCSSLGSRDGVAPPLQVGLQAVGAGLCASLILARRSCMQQTAGPRGFKFWGEPPALSSYPLPPGWGPCH